MSYRALLLFLALPTGIAGAWLAAAPGTGNGADETMLRPPVTGMAPGPLETKPETRSGPGPAPGPEPAPEPAPVPAEPPLLPASLAVFTQGPSNPGHRGQTLFLTIVGDRTHLQWGPAGSRPPRVDGPPRSAAADSLPAVALASPAPALLLGTETGERPYGPAPQACPRTLPPGSSQDTADSLRREWSCRYLSSCDALSGECTWFYQGRG